jgi:hypothetical protein
VSEHQQFRNVPLHLDEKVITVPIFKSLPPSPTEALIWPLPAEAPFK